MSTPKSIKIDNVTYVPEDSIPKLTVDREKTPPVIVRAHSGVFFGYLESKEGNTVTLVGARQIYYWNSAGLAEKTNTCPDMATNGIGTGSKVSKPAPKAIVDQVGATFFMTASAAKTVENQAWSTK